MLYIKNDVSKHIQLLLIHKKYDLTTIKNGAVSNARLRQTLDFFPISGDKTSVRKIQYILKSIAENYI